MSSHVRADADGRRRAAQSPRTSAELRVLRGAAARRGAHAQRRIGGSCPSTRRALDLMTHSSLPAREAVPSPRAIEILGGEPNDVTLGRYRDGPARRRRRRARRARAPRRSARAPSRRPRRRGRSTSHHRAHRPHHPGGRGHPGKVSPARARRPRRPDPTDTSTRARRRSACTATWSPYAVEALGALPPTPMTGSSQRRRRRPAPRPAAPRLPRQAAPTPTRRYAAGARRNRHGDRPRRFLEGRYRAVFEQIAGR